MNAQILKEQLLRSEGYSEGFRVGYAACAEWIARELSKQTPSATVATSPGSSATLGQESGASSNGVH